MKKNVGSIDKIIRLIIAVVAIWAAYTHQVASPWDYVLYAVAVIMILTALTSTCPIWLMTGISTLKSKIK
ncbi:YgaP family membrane protein [Aureibaculum luteum]|uniref:YgaP family membrane protein n=1 Tax=Aureibaculum luteum TaxID=1548456 RepID=UPI001300AA6A|nr:DUF2892 domain-containing protein [Aureibaculum luteum]